ncbi:MAG: hypothetical protein M3R66_05765 [Actinomycetota bacterium]|nr:hypothetical protein [Actinomycetota bacterium]
MTGTEARGYLLDTTALTALPSSRRVSIFVTTAPHFHLPLYAPVTCVDAADRMRPGIARHVGRVPAVEPVDLTYSAVLDLRERTPHMALDVAHVVSLARPSPDWSSGLIVATAQPDAYAHFDLPIYPVED